VCVFITCVANTIEVQILCNIYRFTEYGIQQDLWYRYEDEEGYVYGRCRRPAGEDCTGTPTEYRMIPASTACLDNTHRGTDPKCLGWPWRKPADIETTTNNDIRAIPTKISASRTTDLSAANDMALMKPTIIRVRSGIPKRADFGWAGQLARIHRTNQEMCPRIQPTNQGAPTLDPTISVAIIDSVRGHLRQIISLQKEKEVLQIGKKESREKRNKVLQQKSKPVHRRSRKKDPRRLSRSWLAKFADGC
jgi:hypothetical protein